MAVSCKWCHSRNKNIAQCFELTPTHESKWVHFDPSIDNSFTVISSRGGPFASTPRNEAPIDDIGWRAAAAVSKHACGKRR